jgi:hypothetical protein
MSYLIADPEMMASAASDLAAIGSNVNAAHMVAAARTTAVLPAAADEVSTGIAALFSQHAANYQALAGQAAAFQAQFVQHLTAGAFSYADIEAAIASFLQNLQTLNVDADGLVSVLAQDVSFIAALPLQESIPFLLSLPFSLLLFAVFIIAFLYFSSTGQWY